MTIDHLASLKRLPDAELIRRVTKLAARERGATALLIAHLAELDTRDVLLREGYASLFAYCREALRLSEHEALNRIEAARAARRFPAIVGMLAGGLVNLTAVRLLAPHLTVENHVHVLRDARGKRTEEIRAMAASLAAPVAPRSAAGAAAVTSTRATGAESPQGVRVAVHLSSTAAVTPAVDAPGVPGAFAAPTPSPCKRQVAITGETIEKLRLAKEMLSHALPGGDEGEILDRALTLLLADLARKKFAATACPGKPRGTNARSRSIPAEVKRAVWIRDLGCCAYVGSRGHRCAERTFIEFHHVTPYEAGGLATVENIQLRCGRHNRYEARVYFGREETIGAVREIGPVYGVAARARQGNSF